MGIFIGIGNYIGRKNTFLINKDPSNIYYNLITEEGSNILTEMYNLILRDLNNIASEDSLIIISEDDRVIIRDEFVQPIASYRCYDKTNDDEDRDILKDLSGNGHDIQLYNFAFAESSGYGEYSVNFNNWIVPSNINKSSSKITINSGFNVNNATVYIQLNSNNPKSDIPSFKVKVDGLKGENVIRYRYICSDGTFDEIYLVNGVNIIPYNYCSLYNDSRIKWCGFSNITPSYLPIEENITIEQIPEYQGALVSDGVDDYGLCENFPILTKEKGYTVCVIRKWLDTINKSALALVSNINSSNEEGAFLLENKGVGATGFGVRSFGSDNDIQSYFNNNNIFVYLSSSKYNGKAILKGSRQGEPMLGIFRYYYNLNNFYANAALYALEIYDRDLTDEEIATVKARMIAEYEEKTGNKYEEETT